MKSYSDNINPMILQTIMDSSKAVIYLKAIDGKYIMANNTFLKIFNLTNEDIIGKTDFDIFPEVIAKTFTDNDQIIVREKKSKIFEESTIHNGITSNYITNKFPVYNDKGELIGVCGISTDITEQFESLNMIIESEQTYRTLVANVQGVVYRCDTTTDWRMIFISDYIEQLSGYPASDFILNNKRTYASIIHPDDQNLVENEVMEGIKNNNTYYIQYRLLHKSGSIRWVHEKGRGYLEPDSNEVKWLDGVIMDITNQVSLSHALETQNMQLKEEIEKRKSSEDRLNQLKEQLEIKVIERTESLNKANEKLLDTLDQLQSSQKQLLENKKMIAIGSLVKGICHEISTPLGASLTTNTFIENSLQSIYQKVNDDNLTKDDMIKLLSNTLNAVQSNVSYVNKSISIIDKLRMISSDRHEYHFGDFDVHSIIRKTIHLYDDILQKKNITVHFNFDAPIIYHSCPELYEQMINILVSNAVNHGFEFQKNGDIYISSSNEDGLTIYFSDNGKGIPTELMDKIFDPFYTTKMGEMSGLDLYALHLIVTQKLGGTIHCQSIIDKGTTFIIKL